LVGDTLWVGAVILADIQKPTAPGNLAASVDGSTVNLTWDASTDNATVAGYIVTQDGTKIDSVTTLSASVSGLAAGTYTFGVAAIDNSGNKSTASTVEATVGGNSINTASEQQFIVFPNPAANYIILNNAKLIKSVEIADVLGKVVLSTNSISDKIDVSHLNKGIYLVRVSFISSKLVTEKLIIK